MIRKFNNLWPLQILLLLSLIFIVLPFFNIPKLLNVDFAGHQFAINFYSDFLLPNIQGWNPFQNLGYPIGSYYPPLYHFIISILSSVIFSAETWIKIFFALTVLSLPYAIYYFVKNLFNTLKRESFSYSRLVPISISIITFLFIIALPSTLGGSIKSFLKIGLISNFFTLPILFIYLGLLLKLIKSIFNFNFSKYQIDLINSKRANRLRVVLSKSHIRITTLVLSLLLSFLMLSHLVAGLVALIFTFLMIVYGLSELIRTNSIGKHIIRILLEVLGLSFFIVSFFYIPYILNTSYLTPSKPLTTPIILAVPIFITILILLKLSLLSLIKKTKVLSTLHLTNTRKSLNIKLLVILLVFLFVLIIVPFVDSISARFGIVINFQLLHAYRLLPYAILLSVPIVLSIGVFWFKTFTKIQYFLKTKLVLVFLFLLLLTSIILMNRDIGLNQEGYFNESTKMSQYLGSNFIDLYSRLDILDFPRVPYIPLEGYIYANYSLEGQFEESSYLNHYVMSLKRGLRGEEFKDNQSKVKYIEDLVPSGKRITMMKDLFNVNYGLILSTLSTKNTLCGETTNLNEFEGNASNLDGTITYQHNLLLLCKFRESNLISTDVNLYEENDSGILDYFKSIEANNWNESVRNWWISDFNEILVQDTNSPLVSSFYNKKFSNVTKEPINITWGEKYQDFSITLPDDVKRLALVKVQYNPRWKAYYYEEGKLVETEVVRVSPSMMLINAKGKVTFIYQFSDLEKVLRIVSPVSLILTVIWLLGNISLLYYFKRKRD